jgi:hypothetical protein
MNDLDLLTLNLIEIIVIREYLIDPTQQRVLCHRASNQLLGFVASHQYLAFTPIT